MPSVAAFWVAPRSSARDLGTLPGHGVSEALSISESGDVIRIFLGIYPQRRYPAAQGGAIRDLAGTLPGGALSRALGISNGQVVGTSETSRWRTCVSVDGRRWDAGFE